MQAIAGFYNVIDLKEREISELQIKEFSRKPKPREKLISKFRR